MWLNEQEVLLWEKEGLRKIRRSYLPATHTYEFTFERTDLYCPYCGTKDVWVDQSAGDYYVGPAYRCQCGETFYLP